MSSSLAPCTLPLHLITSMPAGLCQRVVLPRAASSGVCVLQRNFHTYCYHQDVPLLKLSLCLIWLNLKYWYWFRAKELSRLVEGR